MKKSTGFLILKMLFFVFSLGSLPLNSMIISLSVPITLQQYRISLLPYLYLFLRSSLAFRLSRVLSYFPWQPKVNIFHLQGFLALRGLLISSFSFLCHLRSPLLDHNFKHVIFFLMAT